MKNPIKENVLGIAVLAALIIFAGLLATQTCCSGSSSSILQSYEGTYIVTEDEVTGTPDYHALMLELDFGSATATLDLFADTPNRTLSLCISVEALGIIGACLECVHGGGCQLEELRPRLRQSEPPEQSEPEDPLDPIG